MTSERGRIEFLLQRDGIAATIEWVRRTLWIYRHALSGLGGYGHAYRRELIASCCDFSRWLWRQHASAFRAGTGSTRAQSRTGSPLL
jgi:hypothetical protein